MTMIEERYCSNEVVKLLKEKGFDNPTYKCYNSSGNAFYYPYITHQTAIDWLRKKHGILISIIPQEVKIGVDRLCYAIYRITEDLYQPLYNGKVDNLVDSYGETIEAALKYCLTELI